MNPKIAVVGGSFIDIYIYGDEPHRCEILEECGGSGFNVAFALHRLRFEVLFFSNVGEDHRGTFFLSKLQQLGFDTSHIKRKSGETALHISFNDKTIAVKRGVNDLDVDIDWDAVCECSFAFINTEIPRRTIERFLKNFHGKVFLDAGPRRILSDYIRSLHKDLILIGNESQCETLTCDVVKMGPRGARWKELYIAGDGSVHPYTTGCGDVFDAVLIFYLLKGEERMVALERAVKVSQEASKSFKSALAKAQAVADLLKGAGSDLST
ncbi:MAG: PfkB domain protein [Thermotoga sp. 50_1627]|uniref:carbohydrate kinase family protein n=1 Tax=Pseudothermotoga sp. TaxID=2033661 RepID=UPI00076CD91F|nr:MAG: PfkB domain protein [Thermotoga sp. 50_64]KUK24957.1 MAG: PfkB domain protein [Thermotoga sp. 50_1627]MBC7116653.1 carbohydrate kinase [Pseudothermotoga sp.]MDK2922764.1 ribokinase [Pseudothermotoga sp.]